jgi:hypothetical protein
MLICIQVCVHFELLYNYGLELRSWGIQASNKDNCGEGESEGEPAEEAGKVPGVLKPPEGAGSKRKDGGNEMSEATLEKALKVCLGSKRMSAFQKCVRFQKVLKIHQA